MITWIKFSERQPEKEGRYLFFKGVLIFLSYWKKGVWFCNGDCEKSYIANPDYWAEINLPGKETAKKERPDITLGLTVEERADFIDVLNKMIRWFQ